MGIWTDAHQAWLDTIGRIFDGMMQGPSESQPADSIHRRFFDAWRASYESVGRTLGLPIWSGASGLPENVFNVAGLYSRLWQWWLEVTKLGPKWKESDATRSFLDFWRSSLKTFFPGLPLMTSPAGLEGARDTEAGGLGAMSRIWLDSMKSFQSFVGAATDTARKAESGEAAQKEAGGVLEFYDSWLNAYEATVGKFVNVPAVGPARLHLEKLAKTADSYFKFIAASVEFYGRLEQPWLQSMELVSQKASEMLEGGLDPNECRELYNTLIQTGEQRFTEMFKSPAFTHSLETILDRSLDFWQRYSDVTEDMLKMLPVATKSDMEEVYHELYDLRRQVKRQKAVIEKLARHTGLAEE